MVNKAEISPTTIFIVGPTASGKSKLAMELARQLDGELICADSQTIRRGLDIGTAKPTINDQKDIRHHLLDIIGPYESYSVNKFKVAATKAIDDIRSRHKVPIIVGGTGLYVNSLYFDYTINTAVHGDSYKQELSALNVQDLQKIITEKKYDMPKNSENPRHLIGTILREGKVSNDSVPIRGSHIFGLMLDDEVLKKRISDRVEEMFASGFVDEVKRLIEDFGRPSVKMDAIGYPIAMRYLDGEVSMDQAVQLFKTAHWQYARRQKSWFKQNPHISWLNNSSDDIDIILREVKPY